MLKKSKVFILTFCFLNFSIITSDDSDLAAFNISSFAKKNN